MAFAIILCLAILVCLVLLCVAEGAWTKFWIFMACVVCLALLPFQSASITRGSVTAGDTLSACGLREGAIYTLESEVEHTNYRTLIVVRDDSNYTHRACVLGIGDVPQRFVVTRNRAVEVTDSNGPMGDTEWERRDAERAREEATALYEGNFGQGQGSGEEIVVTGHRQ